MLSSSLKDSSLFLRDKANILWIAIFLFGLSEGSPYVGLVGGDAHLNWTITNITLTGIRTIRNLNTNATLIVFYPDVVIPSIIFDNRINYTGNLSLEIVSFTLSNINQSDAGMYTFTRNNEDVGGQVLVIAENPVVTGIRAFFPSAVAGRNYKLNCSADSKSILPGHNLTMLSEWKRNGVNITPGSNYSINRTILTIISVNRTESGDRFTCVAYEDQRKKSSESGEFTLNVLYGTAVCSHELGYGPDNTRIIPSGKISLDEGRSLNITCSAECNPPCTSYQWQKDKQLPPVGNSTSYVVNEVKRTHAGAYTCTVNNADIPNSATAHVIVGVNYGPDTRSVILFPNNNSYELTESSHLFVNCSADCIPECQYIWTGPGGSSYENTGSLTIPQIYRNQTGIFTCTASNPKITNNSATATISVLVLYGPDTNSIVLSPHNNSCELIESSHLSVNCSTECVPKCQYSWTGPGGSNHGSTGSLSIPQINRNQTGVFTCTAFNPRINSNLAKATISVIVLFFKRAREGQCGVQVNSQDGPDSPLQLLPPETSYRLVEKMQIPDINCTIDCFPSCNFQWTGPVPSSTGVISLGTVDRSERGNYTCMGKNPKTQNHASSATVTFIVIYGPDTPVLTPNITAYTLNESNFLDNINCSAECFPNCTSRWFKGQTEISGNPKDTLSLGEVYRDEAGTYTCQCENMESKYITQRAIQLVVQYPPIVSIRNGSFSETELMINCSAHGMPDQYTYRLTQTSLFSAVEIRQLKYEVVSSGVIIYRFTNSSYMDTGNYTCNVSNGIPDYRDGSLHKSMSETILIRGPPNVTSRDTTFYAEKGHYGKLVIELYNSLLDLNVTWHRRRNQTWEKLEGSEKYKISLSRTMVTVNFYSVSIHQPGFTATLEINNVTVEDFSVEDFSVYQVHAQNSAGSLSPLTLNLRPRGRPDVPKNVHIVPNNITISSVDIEWVSGFHGGSNQTFAVEYKEQKNESWTSYSHDVFGGMSENKNYSITVEGLRQNTLYFFQLYAWNEYNKSEYSTIINATTYPDNKRQKITSNGANNVIIGSAVGAIVFVSVAVAFVGILLYRRRKIHKSHNDGLVDNPVYDSSGPPPDTSFSSGATGVEYAKVFKSKKKAAMLENADNLYPQVDKPTRKGKKGAGKGKSGNAMKGEVYENTDMVWKSSNPEDLYENSENVTTEGFGKNVYEGPKAAVSNNPKLSKDGLLYVDLMLDPPTTRNGKPVIRGLENRTEYAEIAYGKRGELLPDSDDEEKDGSKRKK